VLRADAFPTGYHATGTIGIAPGDTVAIFGAGAVGLRRCFAYVGDANDASTWKLP
jgi:glutathione-independent formaldehyde dehydrogenase